MREESDKLCREYGLSVIEKTSGKSKNYAEWQAEKTGKLTQRDTIRRDIDAAIKASVTQQQFIRAMEIMGYEFKLFASDGNRLKYPSIKPPGAKGFFRFHKLGEEYDLPQIVQRIRNNNIREEPFPDLYKPKTYTKGKLNGSFKTIKPKGIYALYLRYCYELGIIKKNPASIKTAMIPSARASRKILGVAGETIARTPGAIRLPLRTSAAPRRSSRRPLVQLPM